MMDIIKHAFSPALIKQIKDRNSTGIDNIDPSMAELLPAGIVALEKGHLVWVVGENENLKEKEQKLKLWLRFLGVKNCGIFCHFKPFEDPYINNRDALNAIVNKVRLVDAFLEGKRLIVLTTRSALSVKIESKDQLKDFFLKLRKGQDISRDELTAKLGFMGYRNRNIVEEPGDMARRGSIVDVFALDMSHPVRLEIEADRLISLRLFNPNTQKSTEQVEYMVFPAARYFPSCDDNADYFRLCRTRDDMFYLTELLDDCRLICSDRKRIDDEFIKLMGNYEKIYEIALEKNDEIRGFGKPAQIFDFPFEQQQVLSINETYDGISPASAWEWARFDHGLVDFNQADVGAVCDKVENNNAKLTIFSEDRKIADNLGEYFGDFQYYNFSIPCSFENTKTGAIFLSRTNFHMVEKLEIISRDKELKSDSLVKEIRVGDLVVHQLHGIGKFLGFKDLGFEDNVSEFLKIEYLNKEYLYVPVYQLNVLSKYVAFEGYSPKMDRMGGNSWQTKQKRAKKSIVNFAQELLQLYATRKAIKGTSFVRDYELEEKLAREFQFVETEDQKRAIRDVLVDLEADFPMDRLICGDVSFGKTEVAIRAAMRVVASGKQVAVLCPTTILAYQHYRTFSKRFKSFPVGVAMLSRMVSAKDKKRTLEGLEAGRIDIVVGTHSLISKNVTFRRLGLYVIDEEQRFGVFQKEKLKENREEIDALSLSATPIPRTLSLSMAGLQDISVIQTPPIGRMAVKNYVGYFSREILVSAVLNELERDGQVFIVFNNIEKIFGFQEQVKAWLPDVPSVVIHARMKGDTIEKNLMDFIGKKYRILISTTIIENGIDIPDVNTLIILGADRFGLTQLYQLRGRIGRGSRQAFAYFLIMTSQISDKAKIRLEAIREFAELGSGYKLAELDLELRGAGSLLGNKQHGHIEALGFDYYHRLLTQTVKELKGEQEKEKEAEIKINFSYSIEPSYIANSSERIGFYRRILEAEEFDHLEELRMELEDRYGRPPVSIEKIFYAGMMRVLAKICRFEAVDLYRDHVIIAFPAPGDGRPAVNMEFLEKFQHFEMLILDEKTCEFRYDDYEAFIRDFRACCGHS